jgi:hypothetical protein
MFDILLKKAKELKGDVCTDRSKSADRWLNELNPEKGPKLFDAKNAVRGLYILKTDDFEKYKTAIKNMNSFADFFNTFVPEKKDSEPKHRKIFYLPNHYFLNSSDIVLTKGIPEIPYMHKVLDMDDEYIEQLQADPVHTTLSAHADSYFNAIRVDTEDPKYIEVIQGSPPIQKTYILFMCIIVKVYVWMIQTKARFTYGELICQRRAREGDYINTTLKELRENIDMIMSVKNENVLYYSPDFVVECFDKYCPVVGRCFSPSTPVTQTLSANSKIISWMHDQLHPPTTPTPIFDYRAFYKNLIVCVFCTFNLSRNSNNPPSIFYIDHHPLKYSVAKKDLDSISTEIAAILENLPSISSLVVQNSKTKSKNEMSGGMIRDANRALTALLHGHQLYPRQPRVGGLRSLTDDRRSSRVGGLRSLTGGKTSEEYKDALYRSISPEIYAMLSKLQDKLKTTCINKNGILECQRDLDRLIELIDTHNAATPIGTLEFVDSVSKLNRVQNICYDYRRPLIQLYESKQKKKTQSRTVVDR